MRIYLITHAHTEQLPDVPSDAWRLSARGQEQAAELARAPFWDEVDRIVVSSEPKSLLTIADIATNRNLPVWIDSRFDELRRGGWSEDYARQVAALFAEPESSIGGWESAAGVRERAWQGFVELQHRFGDERVALVGHGLCLSIVRAAVVGKTHVDFSDWQRLRFADYATVELGNPSRLLADFSLDATTVR
jgi:broad specificity phosphatase PhoE